ncbi:MAG: hypothetical protein ABIO38_03620 [Luteimonas sp.]
MKLLFATAGLTAAMLASIATVQAANEVNTSSANAVARCQGALPNYESALRKRPLAVDNVSTASAFVTCAFEMRGDAGALAHQVDVWFGNNTASPQNITCNGVQGYNGGSEARGKTTTVPANSQSVLTWTDADFTAGIDGLFSLSCLMPAGTGVNDTYASWSENDADAPPAP